MGFIDVILLVLVGAFVFFGLFFGLIHAIGSLTGTIVGIFVSTLFTDTVVNTLGFIPDSGPSKVIVFMILFLLVSRLISILFRLAEKIFGFFSFIPFASTINHLLGAGLGLVEGIAVVGVILFYAMRVLPEDTLLYMLKTSVVANWLVAMVSVLQVFFPAS